MQDHVKEGHKDQKIRCPACGKVFGYSGVQAHIRLHNGGSYPQLKQYKYTCQLKNQGDGQICMLRFTDEKKYLVHKLQKHQDQEDDAEYN